MESNRRTANYAYSGELWCIFASWKNSKTMTEDEYYELSIVAELIRDKYTYTFSEDLKKELHKRNLLCKETNLLREGGENALLNWIDSTRGYDDKVENEETLKPRWQIFSCCVM